MRLILSYEGVELDGSDIVPVLPVEAPDAAVALEAFQAAAHECFQRGQVPFKLFGHSFHSFNFFRRITPQKLAHVNRLRTLNGFDVLQTWSDHAGFTYFYKPPRVETFDQWFERETHKPASGEPGASEE